MAAPRITHHIRKFFEDHPGVTVYREDLIEYCKTKNGVAPTDGGVIYGVKKLVDGGMDIKAVDAANSWRYSPNGDKSSSKDDGELFERVHVTKGGAWILEDTKGEVVVVRVVDL